MQVWEVVSVWAGRIMEDTRGGMAMKAIILSAGLGKRLRPITDNIPKPMVEVAGKPTLEHIVDHLNKYGITEIIVNLHHLPNKIMEHFGTRLLYFYEPTLLGDMGTITSLRNWVGDELCVVMNGDTITNVDLVEMVDWHIKSGMPVTAFRNPDGVCAGTWIISPAFFNSIEKARFSLSDVFANRYESEDSYWFDIGTPEGLLKARRFFGEKISDLPELRKQGGA